MNYTLITLGGKDYQARLDVKAYDDVENKLRTNPLNILLQAKDGQLPRVSDLLTIIHCSLVRLNHGVKMDDVYDAWQQDVDNGAKIDKLIEMVIAILQDGGYLERDNENNG